MHHQGRSKKEMEEPIKTKDENRQTKSRKRSTTMSVWLKNRRNTKELKCETRDLTPSLDEMQRRNQAQAVESKMPKTAVHRITIGIVLGTITQAPSFESSFELH